MRIGRRIKFLRKKKGLTLEELSEKCGLSKGFLSQAEREQTLPSVYSCKKIADGLGYHIISLFFDDELEEKEQLSLQKNFHNNLVKVVKKNKRKIMIFPDSKTTYELLSPDLRRKIEFLYTKADPDSTSGAEAVSHEGEECGIILKGSMEFEVGGDKYLIKEGDSIYFPSSLPHRWKVIGNSPAETVWAITPPSF